MCIVKKILARTLVVSRALSRKEMVRVAHIQPNGEWYVVAEHMLLNFSDRGHPEFRGTSALER